MAAGSERSSLSVSSPDPLCGCIPRVLIPGIPADMCSASCCYFHQGIEGSHREPGVSAVADVRVQPCPLPSPERQKNKMITSEVTEGQTQEYTEN